jgi:cation diffusion facilitator CzcD-associated flavoprotein CzcO
MVGAGLTGIGAVKIFKETFPNSEVELVIYEKNSDVTGTWLENRYPG